MNVSQWRFCKRVKNRGVNPLYSRRFAAKAEAGAPHLCFEGGVSPFVGILQGGWSPCEEWARQDLEPSLQWEEGIHETVC